MAKSDYQRLLAQANGFVQRKEFSAAGDLFHELIEQQEDHDARRIAALNIVSCFFQDHFRAASKVLAKYADAAQPDLEAKFCYAFACFALESYQESIRVSRDLARHNPQHWGNLKTLGLSYLATDQPLEAYLTLSSAILLQPNAGLQGFQNVAMRVLKGESIANVLLSGENFRFHLRVDNGQMLEAAAYHVSGQFTEQQELEMVRNRVRSSDVMVEVGTLVGNHLVYFLRMLRPKKAIVFDISARSIDAARNNARLNGPYPMSPELDFRALGIGLENKTIIGPDGQSAEITSLDEAITDNVDFIKIDVDGLEIEALAGAEKLIARCRPRIMIEIARENEPRFRSFIAGISYQITASVDRSTYTNYCIESAV